MSNPRIDDQEKAISPLRRYGLALLPLIIFAALAVLFFIKLTDGSDPSKIPSVLIGKPAPTYPTTSLAGAMRDGEQVPAISTALTEGKVVIVNVWASWCVPCRAEHPLITKIGDIDGVVLVGINYKDTNENANGFLQKLGNPFDAISIDPKGVASIDWGVYGIPETFLISKTGTVVHKHVGPISPSILNEKIISRIQAELAK